MRIIAALLLTALAPLAGAHDHWKLDEKDTIQRSFPLSGGSPKLTVDTFSGFIHVTGYAGKEIRVAVEKHILANTAENVARAKREVTLALTQDGSSVRVYEDGPFRNHGGTNHRGDDYQVVFDCEIQVPLEAQLALKGFNHGDIVVKNTTGDYDIQGFNGGIVMDAVSGSGSVHTFNGKVSVTYARNPARPSTFKTFNGSVDVYFRGVPDADLSFKKFHGGIYTDFEIASRAATVSGGSGKLIYRSGNRMEGRAGAGGPGLSFDTFNGSIRLHSRAI
jgi:hypothetical protein